mmetsp:Transcript_14559/g.14185  ORF Transcript_14559/g.14185 Transcript_14559/m.14185 type:complete len:200 (-) Transcript_14559:1671-2270(-)
MGLIALPEVVNDLLDLVLPLLGRVRLVFVQKGMLNVFLLLMDLGRLLFLMGAAEHNGLHTKHEGHADEHDEHEDYRDGGLSGRGPSKDVVVLNGLPISWVFWVFADGEEHVDHDGDDVGGSGHVVVLALGGPLELVGLQPLPNDHHVHPPKQHPQEDDLGDELEDEVERLFEVDGVQALHHDAQRHLHHPQDHRDLHLH